MRHPRPHADPAPTPPLRRAPHRPRAALSTLAVALIAAFAAVPALPATAGDPTLDGSRRELDELLGARRDVESDLAVLRASDVELSEALARLEVEMAAASGALDAAYRVRRDAATSVVAHRQRIVEVDALVAELEAAIVDRAVTAYTRPTSGAVFSLLSSTDLTELHRRLVLIDVVVDHDRGLVAAAEAVRAELVALEAAAEAADAIAGRAEAEARAALADLEEVRSQYEAVRAELVRRIAHAETEAAALAQAEAAVRSIIADREAELRAAAEAAAARQAQCLPQQGRDGCAGEVAGVPSSLLWPTRGVVSSEYGPRWGRMHKGIDIAAPTGEPVRAAETGTVVYSGWVSGFGNTVIIDHGGGLMTLYAHQHELWVGSGQWVQRGEPIGAVGSTGESTGPHLHLETWHRGEQVDPRRYFGQTAPLPS